MGFIKRLQKDGTVRFFIHVQACLIEIGAQQVLDFGAGRGGGLAIALERKRLFNAWAQNLASSGAEVAACDIDPALLDHPTADRKIVSPLGQPLPFADASFDAIVSDNTFEHVANKLLRVLKPGGYICARTPSKYGYVALFSALVPSRYHAAILKYVQLGREPQDVFPTRYLLNTRSQVRRHFSGAEIKAIYSSGEPAYDFRSRIIRCGFRVLHSMLVGPLNTTVWFFIRKPLQMSDRAPHNPGIRLP